MKEPGNEVVATVANGQSAETGGIQRTQSIPVAAKLAPSV